MRTSLSSLLRPAAAVAVAALVLSACTNTPAEDPTTEPAPTATTSAPTTPATDAPTGSPTPTGTSTATGVPTGGPADEPTGGSALPPMSAEPQTSEDFPGGGGDLLPTGVRTGTHDGFDRVVVDLEGSDVPGWSARYVEEAVQDGSGNVVEIDGEAILEVVFSGGRYPEEDEDYPAGSTDVEGSTVLEEVRLDGVFEGLTQLFLGVSSPEDFRVFTLTDPVRLVVDVAHPAG